MKKYVFPFSNDEKLFLITQWISNERDRQLLTDWHLNGATQEAIAEKYRLSPRRVQQIIRNSYYQIMDGIMM